MNRGSSPASTEYLPLPWVALLCLALLAGASQARAGLKVTSQALTAPGLQASNVVLQVQPDASGRPALQLDCAQMNVPALGWRKVSLHFQGTLRRTRDSRWMAQGNLALRGAQGDALRRATAQFVLDQAQNTFTATLTQDGAGISTAVPLDQPTHLEIKLTRTPVAWLDGILHRIWQAGTLGKGEVSASVALDFAASQLHSSGRFQLFDMDFDSRSGRLAGEHVAGSGHYNLDSGDSSALALDSTLTGGNVLLGPLYAQLPAQPSRLHLQARSNGSGSVQVSDLQFDDHDALNLRGSMGFSADGELAELKLDSFDAQLPQAYRRYAKTWLGNLGYPGLETAGALRGSLELAGTGLRSFRLHADDLDVADSRQRFSVRHLTGGVDWDIAATRPATQLAWQQLSIYKLPLQQARTRWRSRDGVLSLQEGADIPLLGGDIGVQGFNWRPRAGKRDSIDASLTVTGVDMRAFCKALGWPAFRGTLGGAAPALRVSDERIDLDGGLSLNVFDGFIDVTRLSLEHPFGTAPALNADVSLSDLDLGKVTSVFDIGSITGRLDGHVNKLRLIDWSPVAFEAALSADGGRISQHAVNTLTELGGGGFGGGLQVAMLKLFDSFGYSRIGLHCTLADDICHMGGLDSENGGYTIVEGRGLPHITVIGHQHEVDWPTLIARLQAAIKGQAPVIK